MAEIEAERCVSVNSPTAEVPEEARQWYWGALGFSLFGLGWIWALNHNLRRLAVVLCLPLILKITVGVVTQGQGPWARPLVTVLNWVDFSLSIYLGSVAGRLAWQHRRFRDVADFKACRRIWGWWALGMNLVALAIVATSIAFFVWLDSQR